MTTYRWLKKEDMPLFFDLVKIIEENVVHPAWWLPIKETARDHFFDPAWTQFIGAFEDDVLVGASALFFNEFEFSESAGAVQLSTSHMAEVGRCMVHPAHRGKNLMLKMNRHLLEFAKEKQISTLIATAHPDNLPSNHSLMALGMKIVTCIIKDGKYPRNILVMHLS